jgi:hypothetical protein
MTNSTSFSLREKDGMRGSIFACYFIYPHSPTLSRRERGFAVNK